MKKIFFLVSLLICSCADKSSAPSEQVKKLFKENSGKLCTTLGEFYSAAEHDSSGKILQKIFLLCREQYKHLEFLAEFYTPLTSANINGPALLKADDEEPNVTVEPTGFQVIEEKIFPEYSPVNKEKILQEIKGLQINIRRLEKFIALKNITDAHIFEAMRLEIARISTLGISGFDSPKAQNSTSEARAAISSLQENFSFYINSLDRKFQSDIEKIFSSAIKYLENNPDFEKFDRAEFIIDFANPISEKILFAREKLRIPPPELIQPYSSRAKNIFAEGALDIRAFAPDYAREISAEKISLGEKLFFDPVLSGNGSRSCASCHNPAKEFTDGQEKALALDGKTKIRRNVPTLVNTGFQRVQFYDSRVNFLEDQASRVIENKDEMHGSLENAAKKISANSQYKEKFFRAFGKANSITPLNIRIALASYERSLVRLNSRFDQFIRGDKTKFSTEEKSGFNLFMGKAKCGSCHFAPLFNGTVPPDFSDSESEILGVPANADPDHPKPDSDEGKFSLYRMEIHRGAFKTPTLRNIELTAPYMHNGVFKTLDEVIEFYDRGGGAGIGLAVPNQTLPADKLNLSNEEKHALIAFLRTLTDTGGRKAAAKQEKYQAYDK